MSSLTAKKLTPLCKQIASEHPGWSYVAEHFEYPIASVAWVSDSVTHEYIMQKL